MRIEFLNTCDLMGLTIGRSECIAAYDLQMYQAAAVVFQCKFN